VTVGGFDAATQDLYVQLVRINCFAQVLFAASLVLGEVLVAHRRFVFYALAPVFLHDRDHHRDGALREPVRDHRIGVGSGRGRGRAPRDPRGRHWPHVVPDRAWVGASEGLRSGSSSG
jgi:hypothetical protein